MVLSTCSLVTSTYRLAYTPSKFQNKAEQAVGSSRITGDFSKVSSDLIASVNKAYSSDKPNQVRASTCLSKSTGINLLQQGDSYLSEAETILNRMSVLASNASDIYLDDALRQDINAEFQDLKKQLDLLSDNSGILDGSFGGIQGADGLKAMGIQTIASNGAISGNAKLYINNTNSETTISLRINGETVTNKLNKHARETVFELSYGNTITVGYDDAKSLVSGVVTKVGFQQKQTETIVSKAMSADKGNKNVYVSLVDYGGMILLPNMPDISALGLGIHSLDLGNFSVASQAVEKLDSVGTDVSRVKTEIVETKDKIIRSIEAVFAYQNVLNKIHAAFGNAHLSQPAQLLYAQTNFLLREMALSFLK